MSALLSASKRSMASTDTSQKEILVSQLKTEILELKQNEREYVELAAQLRKLEQRYSLLQEETARDEAEFKIRKTQNFETIVNLRTDIDTMKATIADTKVELQDLKVENQTVKELAEQKGQEAQHLRSDVAQATEENNGLEDTKRRQEAELELAREEKRKLLGKIKDARDVQGDLNYKVSELERTNKEMEYNNTRVERSNAQLQQSIDSLQGELKTRIDNLESVEQQVADSQKAILALERDIQEAERDNDRHRAESQQAQKQYQQEVTKNLDLTARNAIAENNLKGLEMELEELKREYENLKGANSNQLDNNFQLKQELETTRTQIDTISLQNAEIVEELDRLAAEDEKVRSLLNRRDRVDALKFKSESSVKKALHSSRNRLSPSPDRNAGRSSLIKSPVRPASRKSPYKY